MVLRVACAQQGTIDVNPPQTNGRRKERETAQRIHEPMHCWMMVFFKPHTIVFANVSLKQTSYVHGMAFSCTDNNHPRESIETLVPDVALHVRVDRL